MHAPTGPILSSIKTRLRNYRNIIFALMMHDIKNRFFGSGIGQIVMVLWPFGHILILISIYVLTSRKNPFGESIVQYSAVSVFPFIIFNYVSRWIVFSAIQNKSFLQYPIIKPLDILIGRALLETVSISIVGIMLVVFVTICGSDIMPSNRVDAVCAFLGTWFLAIGFGFLNAPFAFILPLWNVVITLFIILAWVSSGVVFLPTALPEAVRYPLSFNPLLNCVEWFRAAYYSDYPTSMADKLYVFEFGLISLSFGLILNLLLKRFY